MTLPQTHTEAPASGVGGVWRAARRMLPMLAGALRGRKGKTADDSPQSSPGGGDTDPETPKQSQQKGGLFRKYAALLVALVAGSLIVSAAIEMYYSYGESRQALIAVQREKAQGAAAVIEQFVKEIQGQVGWATGFLPAGSGLEQRRFDFLRLLRQAPAITEVSYLDADGREQIKVSRLAMDTLANGADLSQEPKFTHAKANKRYLGPVYFRKELEPYITLAMAGTGRTAGVTVAEVNLKFILEDISRIHVGKAGVVYVVDERGLLIAHPDIGIVLRKTDLSRLAHVDMALKKLRDPSVEVPAVSRDRLGREVLTASAPIGTLGWSVFVDVPLSEALQPVYAVLYRTIVVLVGGLLFAALAGVWFARRMVVPIRALASGSGAHRWRRPRAPHRHPLRRRGAEPRRQLQRNGRAAQGILRRPRAEGGAQDARAERGSGAADGYRRDPERDQPIADRAAAGARRTGRERGEVLRCRRRLNLPPRGRSSAVGRPPRPGCGVGRVCSAGRARDDRRALRH